MKITVTAQNGESPSKSINDILDRWLNALDSSGETISMSLVSTVQNHFVRRFRPVYHDPKKVTPGDAHGRAEGSANVGTADAGRAYHDVTILPVRRKRLTIPMHASAFGRKASDFDDLFYVKTKKGTELLGRNDGKGVTWMYALVKKAFQRKDPSIMPDDDTLASDALKNITTLLRRAS